MRFSQVIIAALLAACASAQLLRKGERCGSNRLCEAHCADGEFGVGSGGFVCANKPSYGDKLFSCYVCEDAVEPYKSKLAQSCTEAVDNQGKDAVFCVTDDGEFPDFCQGTNGNPKTISKLVIFDEAVAACKKAAEQ